MVKHGKSALAAQIRAYNRDQEALATNAIREFEQYFRGIPPSEELPYQYHEISSATVFDEKRIHAGRGFYLILSNYVPLLRSDHHCRLNIGGLSVLYRGQADKVKERLESHLCNEQYQKKKNGKGWTRCMKLDEVKGNDGGINFDKVPFNQSDWAVIVLPMQGSTSQMRVLTEWGFDRAWGKPIACKERKKISKNILEVLEDEATHEARG